MVFYFYGSKQIAVLNSQPLWLGETLRLAHSRCEYLQEWIKALPTYLGGLLNPDVVVWKCSCAASRVSSELFVSICLNCTWRKCCCVLNGRSLGFMHHAPIFGVCVREPNLSSQGWWNGCLAGAELLWSHWLPFTCTPPNSGYQNRYWPCIHSKPTASAGVLFFLWTCSVPVSQAGRVGKSKVTVVPLI